MQIKLWSPGEPCPCLARGRTGNWTAWLIACTVIVARNTFHDHVPSTDFPPCKLLTSPCRPFIKYGRLQRKLDFSMCSFATTTTTPSIRVDWQLGFNEPVVQLVAGKNKVSLHKTIRTTNMSRIPQPNTECKSGHNHRRARVCKRISRRGVHNHQGDAHFTQIAFGFGYNNHKYLCVGGWKGVDSAISRN